MNQDQDQTPAGWHCQWCYKNRSRVVELPQWSRPSAHDPGLALDLIVPMPGELAAALTGLGLYQFGDFSRYVIRDNAALPPRTGQDDPLDDIRALLDP